MTCEGAANESLVAPPFVSALCREIAANSDCAMNFWTSAEGIPASPGAYVLAVELSKPIAVSIRNRSPISLAAGRYLYCGSAKGPGGL